MASLLEIAGINEKNLADGVSCALIPSHSPLAPGHSITVVKTVQDDTIKDYRYAHGTFAKSDEGGKLKAELDKMTVAGTDTSAFTLHASALQFRAPCPEFPIPIEGPVTRDITYTAPFNKCDREADYAIAWDYFSKISIPEIPRTAIDPSIYIRLFFSEFIRLSGGRIYISSLANAYAMVAHSDYVGKHLPENMKAAYVEWRSHFKEGNCTGLFKKTLKEMAGEEIELRRVDDTVLIEQDVDIATPTDMEWIAYDAKSCLRMSQQLGDTALLPLGEKAKTAYQEPAFVAFVAELAAMPESEEVQKAIA